MLQLEEEWFKSLAALAGTFGVSAEDVVRRSLPDVAVTSLFFQCKIYIPELRWDEVGEIGRTAIREYLRGRYLKGFEEHLARLGLSLEQSSSDDVEAARQRALNELKADKERPLEQQVAQAEEDSVYLGWLYDAWKQAKAGTPGYTIAQVDIVGRASIRGNAPQGPAKAWAVLKDGKIV